MAAGRDIGEAQRRAGAAFLGTLVIAAAWAQSDKPLDLRTPPADTASTGSVCRVCGEIKSVREIHIGRNPPPQSAAPSEYIGSRPGTDDWRVVGTVAYLPLGAGAKSDEKWRIGAVGTPEMQGQFGESSYEITVLMDSGERRVIQRRDGSRFQAGQRVRLRGGELEGMFP
jgi:outer membrane lipoprotein SlyB